MTQVKTLAKDQKEFTANGVKYLISDKLTPERWKEYEKLVPRLTFGLSFQDVYNQLHKAYGYLNKPNPEPVNAGVVIHNIMNGIRGIEDEKRIHPAMMMAALVILRENEDPRTYDQALMLEKVADWQKEGYDMMSFFALSLSSIQGFRETLIEYTRTHLTQTSQEEKK